MNGAVAMHTLSAASIDSFNYAIGEGLQHVVKNISPSIGNGIEVSISSASVEPLILSQETKSSKFVFPLYPSECRVRKETYCGKLTVHLKWRSQDGKIETPSARVFSVPILLKSSACLLKNMSSEQLITAKEEEKDPGGYFIISGRERIFQTYLVQRQNYPLAIVRQSWEKSISEEKFSAFGVKIRSVRNDGHQSHLTLRYLKNNTVKVMFRFNGMHYFVSLLLLCKVLIDDNDQFLYRSLADQLDPRSKSCVYNMLRSMQSANVYTQSQARDYFGQTFKALVDSEGDTFHVTDIILRESVLINLENDRDKFNMLSFMFKKLLKLVKGEQAAESPDDLRNQELLLGGQLYLMLLRVELLGYLKSVRRILDKIVEKAGSSFSLTPSIIIHCTNKAFSVGHYVKKALSTGNIPSAKMNLDWETGYSTFCESTNFIHHLSYFHQVHKFVYNQYTSSTRKIHPEYWGFICPVQTPSGMKTGFSNYLTLKAKVITENNSNAELESALEILGMMPLHSLFKPESFYHVILDGKVCGLVSSDFSRKFVNILRFKIFPPEIEKILNYSEIVFLPMEERGSYDSTVMYPGIYIFTTPGRLMRPIENVVSGRIEYIGVFEQALINIASSSGSPSFQAYYRELDDDCLFSSISSLIPFFEFNPSVRSINSTHFIKQSIGVSYHGLHWHSDTTIGQINYPQSSLICTKYSSDLELDYNYPYGTNAIVAVLSYSGYDMEDAIALNKSSLERGLARCSIFKNVHVNLIEKAETLGLDHAYALKFERSRFYCGNILDSDGLPHVGQIVNYGDVFCSYKETKSEIFHEEVSQFTEQAYVSDVKILGNHGSPKYMTAVLIQFRLDRHVEVGDKFANRHGQKNVCSLLMAPEDMPFTANGLMPDILFNPHGFPSRMTVGMLLELMAGKATASKFHKQIIEAFQFSDDKSAADYFGRMLKTAGFNYYGTEKMYSGVSGRELECDVFCGVVYYQRLKHMVQDKFQMRSEGKMSSVMHQPIKSASKDGAIRFGEMERDALISHGASFSLQDRFMACSDEEYTYMCNECGEILYPVMNRKYISRSVRNTHQYRELRVCKICENSKTVLIKVPHSFLVLHSELTAMNLRIKMHVSNEVRTDPLYWMLTSNTRR